MNFNIKVRNKPLVPSLCSPPAQPFFNSLQLKPVVGSWAPFMNHNLIYRLIGQFVVHLVEIYKRGKLNVVNMKIFLDSYYMYSSCYRYFMVLLGLIWFVSVLVRGRKLRLDFLNSITCFYSQLYSKLCQIFCTISPTCSNTWCGAF